jgi:acetyl esterase
MMMTRLLRSALVGIVLAASAFAAEVRTPTQEGIVYGVADGQQLTMDYYAPKGAGPHPIAIIIHGGGYQRGNSKSGSEAYCADFLAPAGYAVFSINYRLAPKYPYPYMVYDVERAVRFLRHNASRSPDFLSRSVTLTNLMRLSSLKGAHAALSRASKQEIRDWDAQANRIALVGGSAGGFLSNMVGLLNLPGDPSAADPVDRESAQVQAVVTLFAQSSFATVPLNADVHALLDPLIKEKGEEAALKEASPITYLHKGDPPFLQILGDKDEYIPFSEATNLDAALRKVGTPSEIIRIPGGMHGTGGWHKLPGVPDWEVQMTEWLNRTLGHKGPVGEGVRKREPAPAG